LWAEDAERYALRITVFGSQKEMDALKDTLLKQLLAAEPGKENI
jgi:hypothetical protein